VHTAKLRVELAQARSEQHEYLRNVETARVLEKRAARKRLAGLDVSSAFTGSTHSRTKVKNGGNGGEGEGEAGKKRIPDRDGEEGTKRGKKRSKREKEREKVGLDEQEREAKLGNVLSSIF
jgi:ESF2/ABP1 family protein